MPGIAKADLTWNSVKGIFIPTKDEEIMEVRKLIKLADYEACSALAYHKPSQSPTKSIWQ